MHPVLEPGVGEHGRHDVVREVLDSWPWETKPHIVGDSAFGSFDLLEDVTKRGATATFAIRDTCSPNLWKLLSKDLQVDKHRMAYCSKKQIVASVSSKRRAHNEDAITKCVISSGFAVVNQEAPDVFRKYSLEQAEALSKLPIAALRILASDLQRLEAPLTLPPESVD